MTRWGIYAPGVGTAWPFAGRDADASAVRDALLERSGPGVLVSGAPGSGKSRLLAEVALGCGLLLLVGGIAALVPAWRALRFDPAVVLRTE